MFNFLFTHTPLLFFVQSLWRDEAFTWLLSKRNIVDILVLTAKDFNPPFYYIVMHFWMRLFGSSEIVLRSISLIMYWTTVYCIYLFLVNVLKINIKRIWIYLLFIAINPVFLYYAFEARMYTMLAFFATLSLYSFIRNDYKKYVIATVLGLYTHYFMIFVVIAELIFYVGTHKKNVARAILLKYLVPFILFIPWLIFVLRINESVSDSFWIKNVTFATVVQLSGTIYTGYENTFKFYDKYIISFSIGLFFLILYGMYYFQRKRGAGKNLFWFLLLWAVGIPLCVIAVSLFKPLFLPRYFIFSALGISLLIIYILDHMPLFFRYGLLFVFIFISLTYNVSQIEFRKKSDLRTVFRQIKLLANNNDVVYVDDELNFFVAQYYFDENKVYIYGKSYDEVPSFVGKILIPKSKFASNLPIYPKKAFILTLDSRYEIQAAR